MKRYPSEYTEKLQQFSRILTTVLLVAAAFLRYLGRWRFLGYILPVFGVLQVLQGLALWKTDRDQSAVHLFLAGILCLVCLGLYL